MLSDQNIQKLYNIFKILMKACQLFLDLSKRQRLARVVIQTLKWTKLANYSISPYEKLGLSGKFYPRLILLSKSYFIVVLNFFVSNRQNIREAVPGWETENRAASDFFDTLV